MQIVKDDEKLEFGRKCSLFPDVSLIYVWIRKHNNLQVLMIHGLSVLLISLSSGLGSIVIRFKVAALPCPNSGLINPR